MTVDDFLRSAEVAAPAIAAQGERVGAASLALSRPPGPLSARTPTSASCCFAAPLALAAERAAGPAALWPALEEVAGQPHRRRRPARLPRHPPRRPGGLGRSDAADVQDEPAVTLLEAMRARRRARPHRLEYANGFADIRDTGLPALAARAAHRGRGLGRDRPPSSPSSAAFDDTHIVRKLGPEVAARGAAAGGGAEPPLGVGTEPVRAGRRRCSRSTRKLKAAGINPGTSADLTVATVFARNLLDLLPLERVKRLP